MEETTTLTNNNENLGENTKETQTPVEKPYKLDANIEAMLCYLPFISLFTSIGVLMMEKENKFVRFHAIQGVLFSLVYVVLSMGFTLTFVLAFLVPLLNLAAFVVWMLMIYKTYNNEEYELPVLGKIARDQLK